MLLADEVRGDLKDMAASADELFQHHRPNIVDVVDTAVDEDLAEAVAALAVRTGKAGFRGKKKDDGAHSTGGGSRGSGGSNGGSSGGNSCLICDHHWKYGAKAFLCDDAPNNYQRAAEN